MIFNALGLGAPSKWLSPNPDQNTPENSPARPC